MVSFEQMEALLAQADMQAAEAHGALMGMMCAQGEVALEAWWAQVFEPEDDAAQYVPDEVRQMVLDAAASLREGAGTFDLMLPEDDASLQARADALHEWCHGFLYGYGVAGGSEDGLSEESAEVLRDIAQFAQAAFDLGEDEEEDELSYSELVEYLRVGVMLMYETLYPREQVRPGEIVDEDEPLDVEELWEQIARARAAQSGGGSPTLH
ncbi:MAG: UPF0149 family protein [Pseudomonadota bacterium]